MYSECKAVLKNIHALSDKLTTKINEFFSLTKDSFGPRRELSRLLMNDDHDLFKIYEEIIALYNATSKVLSDKEGALQKDLPNMPFFLLIKRLKDIFEDETRKKATISLYESKQPGTKPTPSKFLEFVDTFLEVFDPEHRQIIVSS